MTRVLQSKNKFGDAGACALGEVLKMNSSLTELTIVSVFVFLVLLSFVVGRVQATFRGTKLNDA